MKHKKYAVLLAFVLAFTSLVPIYAEDVVLEESGEVLCEEAFSEAVITELLQEFPEDSCSDKMEATEVTEDIEAGYENTTVNLQDFSEEVMILSVEEVAEYVSQTEVEILSDTVEDQVLESGLSTNAVPARTRAFSRIAFDGCYGNQLNGTAREVYDAMVRKYVNGGEAGSLQIQFAQPVTFRTVGTPNGSGGLNWSSKENAEYQQKVSYAMQAAYDAFVYDYPQVFWMDTFSYSTAISFSGGEGSYTGKVTRIKLIPNEDYTGAYQEKAGFDAAVKGVAAAIGMDTARNSRWEIVKKIHDYLCAILVYGDTAGTYTHSAAGAFLKGGSVVCEGYAKAFKILCNYYGIECILVVGVADGGHMWNYVRMEDQNWYLVDVTWDDQGSRTVYDYFLAGSGSVGFNGQTLAEERSVYMNFSGAVYTQYFTGPVLNETAYIYEAPVHAHNWQMKEEKEATCQAEGYRISLCSVCKEESKTILERTKHRFEDNKYKENHDAGCTVDGTRTVLCDYGCGTTGGKIVVKGSALGHSFVNYTSNRDARFTANGTKTASCSRGCGAVKTVTDKNTKVKLSVSSMKLKKGQSVSVSKIKVTGLPKGVKIVSWKPLDNRLIQIKNNKIVAQKKTGSTKLRVTIGNGKWTDSAEITVKVQSGTVKTTKISVDQTKVTLKKGKKYEIAATKAPFTSGQSITYTSSNKEIADVSSKGVVTAKGAGKAVITVKSGSKTCTVTITVPKTKTQKINNLPTKGITLKKGKTKQLNLKLYPINSDEKLYYKSGNKAVAAISSKGKITAKKAGTVTITVKSGSVIEKFKVTVK